MKGLDLFCSSSASTAVNSSTNRRSVASRSTKWHANVRRKSLLHVPCSSKLPIIPKPYQEKHRKSLANKQNSDISRKSSVQVDSNPTGSSTRYLLSDVGVLSNTPFIDWVSEPDKFSAIVPTQPSHKKPIQDQVVVLRVSLHCKACVGKVRKHISKMEGVTSFNIDMESKKVTIIGHVTPSMVLASVSKVKNAQLWSSPKASLPSFVPTSRLVNMSY